MKMKVLLWCDLIFKEFLKTTMKMKVLLWCDLIFKEFLKTTMKMRPFDEVIGSTHVVPTLRRFGPGISYKNEKQLQRGRQLELFFAGVELLASVQTELLRRLLKWCVVLSRVHLRCTSVRLDIGLILLYRHLIVKPIRRRCIVVLLPRVHLSRTCVLWNLVLLETVSLDTVDNNLRDRRACCTKQTYQGDQNSCFHLASPSITLRAHALSRTYKYALRILLSQIVLGKEYIK